MTAVYFALLVRAPFWIAFVPCVCLAHRIGIMLHEYFHGVVFHRNRDNHAVVTLWDGVMMTLGTLELTRGMHLTHHKHLNIHDAQHGHDHAETAGLARIDAIRHVTALIDALRGKVPYVQPQRIVLGFALSAIAACAWVMAGYAYVVWESLLVVAFTVTVPVSLRGAIEHNSTPGDDGFANEYRTYVPMFNVNRHIHHHEDPTVPWYRLEWRTANPLPAVHYMTHWFRVHVLHELVQMRPMPARRRRAGANSRFQFRHSHCASPAITPKAK